MERYSVVLLVILSSLQLQSAAAKKPNIVYILTDDQDIKLGSLDTMEHVRSELTDQGLFFDNAFVTTPVCCPSRSSILTGKYVHNHKTFENSVASGCASESWRQLNEEKTIGAYMSAAGYNTGFFGKYLNNYALKHSGVSYDHIPTGWHTWFALQGNSKFYNYSVSNQGVPEHHKSSYEADYFTDVISRHAEHFIRKAAPKAREGSQPFFMYVATPAPHRPATPAPQYAHKLDGKKAPRTESFGWPAADKHWIISQGTPPLNSTIEGAIDDLYQLRIESLYSVDDLVHGVMQLLEKEQLLEDTFVFYNSDHGYHLGQFKQQGEKRQIYDENIRVPLIVRGPGVPAKQSTPAAALNIDLAPTFLDLAGAPIPADMDGESLKPVLMGETPLKYQYEFLVEYFGEGKDGECFFNTAPVPFLHDCHNNTFLALRSYNSDHSDFVLATYYLNDTFPVDFSQLYFKEYYDITEDAWQMKNTVAALPADQSKQYMDTIMALHSCSGSTCRKIKTH